MRFETRVFQRVIFLSLAFVLALALLPLASLPALAEDLPTVSPGSTVTTSGSYQIAPKPTSPSSDNSYGTITIASGSDVTLVGYGIGSTDFPTTPFLGLKIVVEDGARLTLEDVYIQTALQHEPDSIVDLVGNATLNISGVNILENRNSGNRAVIHVGSSAQASFTGADDAHLYIYKEGSASAIGADARIYINPLDPDAGYSNQHERSGAMDFQSGNWYVYSNNSGTGIGTNNNSDDKPGDIRFSGATVYTYSNALGAAVGSGGGSGENPPGLAGDVYLSNGQLYTITDFMASTIGRGGHRDWDNSDLRNALYSGRLIITGGSLKNVVNPNSSAYWMDLFYNLSTPTVSATAAITAAVQGSNGEELAVYRLDINDYAASAAHIEVDGQSFYNGSTYKRMFADLRAYAPLCWPAQDPADPYVYLYLSKADHLLEIDGAPYSLHWNTSLSSFELQQGVSSPIWDGAVDVSWYNSTDSEFTLTSPAQLAGLAALVNGYVKPGTVLFGNRSLIVDTVEDGVAGPYHRGGEDFSGKIIHLGSDMDMGGVPGPSWTGPLFVPIGGRFLGDSNDPSSLIDAAFNGVFYGEGYSIKSVNLDRPDAQEVGIFGRIGAGDEDGPGPYPQLVTEAGVLQSPLVSALIVGSASIRGGESTGGIVGRIGDLGASQAVTIENCASLASVYGTGKAGVGGIAGRAGAVSIIRECYCDGLISITNALSVVDPEYTAGGLVGSLAGALRNSYSASSVQVDTGQATVAALAVGEIGAAAQNCYWLQGVAATGLAGSATSIGCAEKTQGEMESPGFLALLNDGGSAFRVDTLSYNNGMPALRFQYSLDISAALFAAVANLHYTGRGQTPALSGSYQGSVLVADTDYTVVYARNTAIGMASISVFGRGDYRGYKPLSFTIVPADTSLLATPIASAQEALQGVVVAEDASTVYDNQPWVTQAVWDTLATKIALVQAAFNDPTSPVLYTQDEIGLLVGQLQAAVESFKGAISYGALPYYPADSAWQRLAGETRYEAMESIVRAGWTQSDTAIIAKGTAFPDALAASALAGIYGAPIMLTEPNELFAGTEQMLGDLGVKKVIICGGTASVTEQVMEKIRSLVPDTTRIAGADRFEAALNIYRQGSGNWGSTAIITDGGNYPDALSASAFAFAEKAPVFLSDKKDGLTAGAIAELKAALNSGALTRLLICGGPASVPDSVKLQLGYPTTDTSVFTRLGGADRFQASAAIADYAVSNSASLNYHGIAIATGGNFPDALAGGAFAGRQGSVVLLAQDNAGGRYGLENIVRVRNREIGTGFVLGGTASVSEALMTDFLNASLG
jgi:putative cell wall-binding protein